MPRIYRADHTAHIRDRLKRQALHFSTGAVLSVLSAVTVAVLLPLAGEGHHTLTVAARGLVIAVLVVAGIGLTITGIEYLVYRRRRAELDAAGAEASGELNARLHRPKDDA